MTKSKFNLLCLKILYVFIASSSFFVFALFPFTEGIDGSWVYAVNRFFSEGLLWGRNIIFTYGPLGFLLMLWPVGNNAALSLAFWLIIFVLTLCITSYVLFSERMKQFSSRYDNLFMSFILLYMAVPLSFQALKPEYVMLFIVLYLLSICYVKHDMKPFIAASVISVFSMFTKFNAGAANYAALFMFSLVMILQLRTYKFMIIFILSVIAFPLCFLIYNPDLTELYYYVRGAYEVSSGYISGMSSSGGFRDITFLAFFIFGITALLLIMLTFRFEGGFFSKFQPLYALIFLPGVMMVAKHTFLVHGIGFDLSRDCIPALLVFLSIYLIFTPQNVIIKPFIRKLMSVCVIVFFIFTFIISALGLNTKAVIGKQLLADSLTNPIFRFADRFSFDENVKENEFVILPNELTDMVSNDTVAIYPWELTFARKFPKFRNMPVIQAYSAYTSLLDNLNAEFFNDDTRAPKYIVFSIEPFYNRFPLIDCPESWLEIFRNYSIKEYRDKYFVLERKTKPIEFVNHDSQSVSCSKNDIIILPETNHLLTMKLDMRLSVFGQLAKIFYRIPEVLMTVEFEDGRRSVGRVLIDVLSNETIISNVIQNDEEFTRFMNGDISTGKVKSIQFSGDGLKYYSDGINITFTELE